MKELILLGASGSIGTQTLDIVREFNDKFQVLGLSVGSDLEKAKKIIEEFKKQNCRCYVIDICEGDHFVGDIADKDTLHNFFEYVINKENMK